MKQLKPSYFINLGMSKDWLKILQPVLSSPEMYSTMEQVEKLYKKGNVFPYRKDWFNAFKITPYNNLKVLIIGQDPYHDIKNDKPTAHGLAFSYQKSSDIDAYEPPSLKNILREVETDIHDGMCFGECLETDLTRWAKQGVLLLNTALTVEQNKPGSHMSIWKPITQQFIKHITVNNPRLVCMLWGNFAKSLKPYIHTNCHILESGHPSPLSANKGLWFGNKHFSKANQIIEKLNGKEYIIKW